MKDKENINERVLLYVFPCFLYIKFYKIKVKISL